MNEWQKHNATLQAAYRSLLLASKQKEKEDAYNRIESALKWPPFEDFCLKHSANIYSIGRYGLDYMTESCISMIDEIANGKDNN